MEHMGYITYIYTHTHTVVQCTSTSSLDRLQPAVAEYVQVAEYQKTVGFPWRFVNMLAEKNDGLVVYCT